MGQSIQEWTKYILWKTALKKTIYFFLEYFVSNLSWKTNKEIPIETYLNRSFLQCSTTHREIQSVELPSRSSDSLSQAQQESANRKSKS